MGILPGILALAAHSTGILTRVFLESVDNLPASRMEKVSMGSLFTTYLYAAIPESSKDWINYASFEFEANVRAGVVLGILGIGGLGDAFHTSLSHWSLHRASTFLLLMVLLTLLIDRGTRWLLQRR